MLVIVEFVLLYEPTFCVALQLRHLLRGRCQEGGAAQRVHKFARFVIQSTAALDKSRADLQ